MKKKLFFVLAGMVILFGVSKSYADVSENNAVYAWVDGESTCYQLSAMPKVTYAEGAAVLTINGNEDVLTLKLKNGAKLITTFGVYEPSTGITDDEVQPVRKSGKYIIGGRLIIVKDGMQFDVQGNRIK